VGGNGGVVIETVGRGEEGREGGEEREK